MSLWIGLSAKQRISIMYLGCALAAIGFGINHFTHTRYSVAIAVLMYLIGAGSSIESQLRLRAGIRNGLYPYAEILKLRGASQTFLWRAPLLAICLLAVGYWHAWSFHAQNSGQPSLWLFLLCLNSVGNLTTTLRTPYNNVDGAVRYPKTNWPMAAFFISAFVAWLIADNWVPTNRVLHWLLISYAVLSIVIMGAVSSPDWPEPADRPWTEREDAQIESGILAPIRSEG